jgi:hypothetical protein
MTAFARSERRALCETFRAVGRTDHARVELDGEPQDVTAFRTGHLGL